jgi:hypothetical protein
MSDIDDISTHPIRVDGVDTPWQPELSSWSFGESEARVVGAGPDVSRIPARNPDADNVLGSSTAPPQRLTGAPRRSVVLGRLGEFGKKAFQPLSHWEGVVEAVNGDSFYRPDGSDKGW